MWSPTDNVEHVVTRGVELCVQVEESRFETKLFERGRAFKGLLKHTSVLSTRGVNLMRSTCAALTASTLTIL